MNGRPDDGFLKIPLPPPPGRGGDINFESGEDARTDNPLVIDAVVVAVEQQEPNTLIFLHTSGFEAQTEKDAITGQEFDDIVESKRDCLGGFKERLYYIDGNSFNSISASASASLRLRFGFAY